MNYGNDWKWVHDGFLATCLGSVSELLMRVRFPHVAPSGIIHSSGALKEREVVAHDGLVRGENVRQTSNNAGILSKIRSKRNK